MDPTAAFYSRPTYSGVGGGGFPVFSGSRRQRGGGIFGSLARMVLPVVKSVGTSILKSAGQQALGLASDAAQSALRGEGLSGVRRTLRQQGLKRLKNVGMSALSAATQQRTGGLLLPPPNLRKRRHSSTLPTTTTTVAKKRRKKQASTTTATTSKANF